jgi:hypothetical protein
MTGTEWERLARLVVGRRIQLGMKTTKALSDRSGLTTRALGDVENARRDNYTAGTKAQIETALEWAPGSIDRILSGGAPDVGAPREFRERQERHGGGYVDHQDIADAVGSLYRLSITALKCRDAEIHVMAIDAANALAAVAADRIVQESKESEDRNVMENAPESSTSETGDEGQEAKSLHDPEPAPDLRLRAHGQRFRDEVHGDQNRPDKRA